MTSTTALRPPYSIAGLNQKLGWPASPLLGTDQLEQIYETAIGKASGDFFGNVLSAMGVDWEVAAGSLGNIPKEGPVVIVANHPFGGLDGIVLGAALSKVRPDFKLLLNYLLGVFPALDAHSIPVDPFGDAPKAANFHSMRQSLHYLNQGGCLVVFPAGKVSHYHRKENRVSDGLWNDHAAALARKTKAKVVPVYFEGRNSIPFQVAGMVHPRFRTALLPREMLKMAGATVRFSVGRPVGPEMARRFESPMAFTHYLRLSTYALKGAGGRQGFERGPFRDPEPIAPGMPTQALLDAVQSLPPEAGLLHKGEFSVYCQTGKDLPECLLTEIGRLRELTFREVGEGTGHTLDLDSHDPHYHQLFLWDHKTCQVVGAYRLCKMDEVVATQGVEGLYSAKLFDLNPAFLAKLGKTIELGRSFIRPEYQRKHASLSLVWQGIGEFVRRNPGYGNLFGCVSLTSDYAPVSRDLMVGFLKSRHQDRELSPHVEGLNPPRICPLAENLMPHLEGSGCMAEALSFVVSSVERDGKGMPVLLRHYLKLNGTLLSFHLDKDFNNTTVGLILVRIKDIEPGFRKKFLGD